MSGSLPADFGNITTVNPLDVYAKTLQAQKSGLDIQNARSAQAWGEATRQAVDPVTGVLDPNKAAAIARSMGAVAGPGAIAGLQGQSTLMNEQISRAHVKLGWVNGALGALPDNATRDQIVKVLQGGVASNIITPTELQADINDIPTDPAQIPGYLQQHRLTAASAMDQYHSQYGTRQQVDRGPDVTFPVVPPASQGGTGPTVTKGLTPGEQTDMIDFTDPDTQQPMRLPRQQYFQKYGWALPGEPGAPAPAAVPSSAAPGTGGGATTGATAAPPKAAATGPNPDDAARWDASRQAFNKDTQYANSYTTRMFPITQALHILEDPEVNVNTGAGAQAFNQIKSFVKTMTGDNSVDSVKSMDELGKYFTQIVTNNPASSGSDMALGTALSGSPNTHLTKNANIDVAKGMVALERMKQMAYQEFVAQGGLGHMRDWNKFLTDYQSTHDVRAFVYDLLAPDKRDVLLKSMDGPPTNKVKARERINFGATLDLLHAHPDILTSSAMP